jgi:nucleotide-binding universal stress UspA family protein
MIAGTGAEIVLGSVPLDVTTAAHCPVTVVRGESAVDHVAKGHRGRPAPVLLGIESVGADAAAVTVAFDDADRHGSGVVVMHVPGHLGDSASAVRDQLAPWRSAHPDVEVTVRIGQGNPGVALLHESTAVRHIVLGTRGRHAVVRAVLGSVSRFVLRHSLVPVTVVPRSLTTAEGSSTVPAAVAGDPHDRSQLW